MAGLPIFGPAIVCGLLTAAAAMAWIATPVSLATALAMMSLTMIYLLLFSFVSA